MWRWFHIASVGTAIAFGLIFIGSYLFKFSVGPRPVNGYNCFIALLILWSGLVALWKNWRRGRKP